MTIPIEIGSRFGKLTVITFYGNIKTNNAWVCRCVCGKESIVSACHLRSGHTTTCGCGHRGGKNNLLRGGYGDIAGGFWNTYRVNAKKRGISFNITAKDAWEQYLKQGGLCAYTGVELKFHDTTMIRNGNASLDRIDSKKGYELNNIQWVHKDINVIKWALPENIFIQYCHQVASRRPLLSNSNLQSMEIEQRRIDTINLNNWGDD